MIPYHPQPSLSVGPLTIHAFGAIVALAGIAGIAFAARRFRTRGLDTALAEQLSVWIVFGGILGAHLFSVLFYFPGAVARNPVLLLKVWENISSFGGILGGVIGAWLYFRLRAPGMPLPVRLAYLDVAAVAFSLSLMIGRVACSLAHDHPGRVTDFPLALSLRSEAARQHITRAYAGTGRLAELPGPAVLAERGFHDLGLYELLYLAAIVVPAMLLLDRRTRMPGFLVAAFIVLYMPVRFLLDFLRVADARYAGLTPAQWVAAASIIALPVAAAYVRRRMTPDAAAA